MKKLMHGIFLCSILMAAGHIQAQLPSEKPMREVYSKQVQEKLDAPKTNASQGQLPSTAKLPQQVTAASLKQAAHPQPASPADKSRKLPSNSRERVPKYKRPKKS